MAPGSEDQKGATYPQQGTAITAPASALTTFERVLDDNYPRGNDGRHRLPGRSILPDWARLKRWTPA